MPSREFGRSKYLIVLDDMWNENHARWVELKNLLTIGAYGSKIIVTTRNQSVASIVGTTDHNVEVQGLSHEECLSLFIKWAFRSNQDAIRHPHLVEIARSIVGKCKGVPLAVRTLGSILYTKTNESEWINVRDNEIWNLEQNEYDVLPALKLSYSQLPTNLRRCFAFCSLFPKDYQFINLELTMYWQANGLLQQSGNNQDVEDVGTIYINKLLSRGFFQEFEDHGSIQRFKMHDLVHDLASLVAEHDCIYLCSKLGQERFPTKIVRHLSFSRNYAFTKERSNWLLRQKENVHTFIFPQGLEASQGSFVETCIFKFKSLRTLNICGSHFEMLPSSIGRLKHLKNLALSGNSQLKTIPASVCDLMGLEVLELTGCLNIEKLPKRIGQLVQLRNLAITTKESYLPENEIRCLTSLRILAISDCPSLQLVMSNDAMRCLSSLRVLSIHKCESLVSLPARGLRQLTQLETFSILDCRCLDFTLDNNFNIDETSNVWEEGPRSLETLSILGVPDLETLPLWLVQGAYNLKFLGVGGCDNLTNIMPEVMLKSLKSLQKLAITSCPKLTRLPGTIRYLTTLKEIHIWTCPELFFRCLRDGDDWHQICHVPRIRLDGIEIQS